MSKNLIISKHPIFYNEKEYEIRIEYLYGNISSNKKVVNIYKVNNTNLINRIINRRSKYKKVFSCPLKELDCYLYKSDIDYYIVIFKEVFEVYLKNIKRKNEQIKLEKDQIAALKQWDGVIEEIN